MNKVFLAGLMVLVATAAMAAPYLPGRAPAAARIYGTPHVSTAQVVDRGMLRLDSGFDYGSGIKFNGQNSEDFNSLQFLVSGGYGMYENIEVGGRLAYESNSGKFTSAAPVFPGAGNAASTSLPIEDNGLEYLQLFGKYQYNPQIAAEAFVGFAGDNKIYHGMDNFDFGLKGIFSSDMGIGTMHGELGWVFKGGKHNLGGNPGRAIGMTTTGYENIITYGVGFEWPYQDNITFISEIYGWQSPYDKWAEEATVAAGGDNFLALDLGVKYGMASDMVLNGTLGLGLSDGAPAFTLYAGVTKMFDMGAPRSSGSSGTPPAYSSTPGPAPSSYTPPPTYTPPAAPQVNPREQARLAVERGNAAFSARDYATAATAYREATTYDPQNQLAFFNLGVSYYSLQRFSEAVDAYQSASRINPSDVDAHLWLGMAYYQQGDSAKAISEWQRVIQLDPGNQTAQNNLKALGAY